VCGAWLLAPCAAIACTTVGRSVSARDYLFFAGDPWHFDFACILQPVDVVHFVCRVPSVRDLSSTHVLARL